MTSPLFYPTTENLVCSPTVMRMMIMMMSSQRHKMGSSSIWERERGGEERERGPGLNGALWERQWAHWAVTQRTLTHRSCQRVWKHPHWATMANFIAPLGPLWIHTYNGRIQIRCSVIREIQHTTFLQCLHPFGQQQMAWSELHWTCTSCVASQVGHPAGLKGVTGVTWKLFYLPGSASLLQVNANGVMQI